MIRLLTCVFFIMAWTSAWADTGPLAAWIAFGADGHAHIHAIVTQGQACPTAQTSSGDVTLAPASAASPAFPVTACAAAVPPGVSAARVGPIALAAPKPRIDRIVILGDTGCRLKGKKEVQACNDPRAWPFAAVAREAAAEKPDLVIHVGDYNYRETACPNDNDACRGSPWGDNWATWDADFFTPAAPLLAAAPWVMERGNHEECARSGLGWTLLLSPDAPAQPGCEAADKPYAVDLGGVSLVVVDDNDAGDSGVGPDVALRLEADIRAAMPQTSTPVRPWWLLTHHPAHGVVKLNSTGATGANPALGEALDKAPAPQLLLSGHIHTFMIENFAGGHPPQMIAGTGGDNLEKARLADLSGVDIGGWTIQDGFGQPDFGYVVMERDGQDWRIIGHSPDGTVARRCLFHAGRIDCPH